MKNLSALPINAVGRNAMWSYDRFVAPRFPGAPTIIETTRSYEMPDIAAVPEGSDIAVELYGGVIALRLDGWLNRISIERYTWIKFANQEETRIAFLILWRSIEPLDSTDDVRLAIKRWRDEHG